MVKSRLLTLLIPSLTLVVYFFMVSAAHGQAGAAETAVLIEQLKDPDSKIRARAAELLSYKRDSRAVEPLIVVLGDDSPEVRKNAARALGKIGETAAVEPLKKLLEDGDGNVRWWAAWALKQLGHAQGRGETGKAESKLRGPLPASLKYSDALKAAQERAAEKKCPLEITGAEVKEAIQTAFTSKLVEGEQVLVPTETTKVEGACLAVLTFTNTTDNAIKDFKVFCYLYDAEDNYIGAGECRTELTNIAAGEEITEKWLFENPNAVKVIFEFSYIRFEDGGTWELGVVMEKWRIDIGSERLRATLHSDCPLRGESV